MTCADSRLQKIYRDLCKVMRYPHEFGLGDIVPLPLANVLEETLSTLSAILQERGVDKGGDLDAELSQDADQLCMSTSSATACQLIGISDNSQRRRGKQRSTSACDDPGPPCCARLQVKQEDRHALQLQRL